MSKPLPEIVGEIYALLEPLESEDRKKVVSSALTLMGEQSTPKNPVTGSSGLNESDDTGESECGPKVKRWMKRNNISLEHIEELFHIENGVVEIIAGDIPGSGKKQQTERCYLLSGIRSYLETDEPKFTESEVVELCKHMGCHDSANHYKTRGGLGKYVAGKKQTGFTLPAPGLKAAAALVVQLSNAS